MALTFDNAPLAEVALGAIFLPRPDFLVPHYGAFWQQVKDEFPRAEHAPPIMSNSDDAQGQFFLPRVWLVSLDSSQLLQLQQNRFHFNWRATPASRDYVRFQAVCDAAARHWSTFSSFLQTATGQPVQPIAYELTYTNLIDAEASETAIQLAQRVLRDPMISEGNRFLPTPTGIARTYTYTAPGEAGELTVAAGFGMRATSRAAVLKLDLTMRGKASPEVTLEKWAPVAHDFLVNGFKDVTTTHMHRVWKLQEHE